jgi:hypothetical protein
MMPLPTDAAVASSSITESVVMRWPLGDGNDGRQISVVHQAQNSDQYCFAKQKKKPFWENERDEAVLQRTWRRKDRNEAVLRNIWKRNERELNQ